MNQIFTIYFNDYENIVIKNCIYKQKPFENLLNTLQQFEFLQHTIIPRYLNKIECTKIQTLDYYTKIMSLMFKEFCNNRFLKMFYNSFIDMYLKYINENHTKAEYFSGILYILKEKDDKRYFDDEYKEPLFDNIKDGSIYFLNMLSIKLNSILMLFNFFSDNTFNINNEERLFLFKNLYMDSSNAFDFLPKSKQIFLVNQNNNIMPINIFRKNHLHIKESLANVNNYYEYLLSIDTRINEIVQSIKDIEILYVSSYEIFNIFEYINICILQLTQNNTIIKKCKNCNNYFIPESRTDEVYCNRISPQNPNKTCKEYGAKKTYRDEIKSIPIKYEHNKTSQFYRMRINRAKTQKEKEQYQKKFNTYKDNYQKKKEKYNAHKLEELAFVEWIRNQKEF